MGDFCVQTTWQVLTNKNMPHLNIEIVCVEKNKHSKTPL
jgi:hypothetical protein